MGDNEPLSRRDLLRGRFFGRIAASAAEAGKALERAVDPHSPQPSSARDAGTAGRRVNIPVHRPPGAINESAFLATCTRCDKCVQSCPVGAIVHAPERFRAAQGTPMIDAHASACIMCADTPCITACEPKALRADWPLKMGVAWIQEMACLAHTGSFCTVCSERCPVPGAIEVRRGKPTIRADVCTGCGTCLAVCPAPSNAIVVMPMADRAGPQL
jgi:ferredoxin-type protein NapG